MDKTTKNSDLDVFQFEDPVEFLICYHQHACQRNRNWSLRSFSAYLGYKSPALLSLVMSYKKPMTSAIFEKLCKKIIQDPDQLDYFKLIFSAYEAPTPKDRLKILGKAQAFRSKLSFQALNPSTIDFEIRWFHLLILDWCENQDRKDPSTELIEMCSFSLDIDEMNRAVEQLYMAKLLTRSSSGYRKSHHSFSYKGQPNQSMRQIQKDLMQLGIKSIDIHSPNIRSMGCRSVWAYDSRIKEAKKMIEAFRFELGCFLEREDKNQSEPKTLYQINVQFFPMLKCSEVQTKGD